MSPDPTPGAIAPQPRWRTGVLIAIAVVAGVAGVAVLAMVLSSDGAPLAADRWLQEHTEAWTNAQPWAVDLAAGIGLATGPVPSAVITVVLVVIFAIARRWPWAFFLAGSGIAGVLIAEGVKLSLGRPRPPGAAAHVTDLDKSFPSGHAMAGLYVYGTIAVVLLVWALSRGHRWPAAAAVLLFIAGVTIGLSRIVLGVHWLSDVLAGWCFGSMVLLAAAAIFRPDDYARQLAAQERAPEEERP